MSAAASKHPIDRRAMLRESIEDVIRDLERDVDLARTHADELSKRASVATNKETATAFLRESEAETNNASSLSQQIETLKEMIEMIR